MAQANVATLPVNHEDLSDELAMVNAADTVMASTINVTGPAENSKFSAPMDKHKAGRLGGKADGASVDRTAVTNRLADRKSADGVVQHFREDYGVSLRATVTMRPAGIEDAYADSESKALVTQKESLEMTLLSQQNAQEGSTADEYLMWGFSRTIDASAQPLLPIDSTYRPGSSLTQSKTAVTDITEADHRNMMQYLFEAKKGAINASIFCTPDWATNFDSFFVKHSTADSTVPVRSFNYEGGDALFEMAITGYNLRWGKAMVMPSLHLNATRNNASLAGASTTNTDATVTVTSTAGLQKYMRVYGTGIPAGAYIASITDATTFELSAAATATGTPTLRLGEWDHALWMHMEFLELKQNMAPTGVDLSPDGSGKQGYVDAFWASFNKLPYVHGKQNTTAA